MSGVPAPVRLTIAEHGRLPSTLRGRLEQRRAELIGGMSYASDWADYRHRVGVINGVAEAIEICGQIEKDLMSGER